MIRATVGALMLSTYFASIVHPFSLHINFLAASSFRRLEIPTDESENDEALLQPPIARRDETRVVLAGNVVRPDSTTTATTASPSRQSSTSTNDLLDPPISVPDPYGWMRDESRSPQSESYDYIENENKYTKAYMEPLKPLRQELYRELLHHLNETDYSFPAKKNDYQYYTRTMKGKSYVRHCRAGRDEASQWDGKSEDMPIFPGEDVYLDENILAAEGGEDYSMVESVRLSKSGRLVGYMWDNTGDEIHDLIVKDLRSGEIIHQSSRSCDDDDDLEWDATLEWADNDHEVFVVEFDDTHRPFRVYKRTLNPDEGGDDDDGGCLFEDKVLFEDLDEAFEVDIFKSSDDEFLFVQSQSMETTEIWYLPLKEQGGDGEGILKCVTKRKTKVLYDADHHHGQFILVTNVGGSQEMRLMVVNVASSNDDDAWSDVIDTNGGVLFGDSTDRVLESIKPFNSHIVIMSREDGLPRIWIMTLNGRTATSFTPLKFNETTYDVDIGPNYEYDSPSVIIEYSSPITPIQYIEFPFNDSSNTAAAAGTILKQKYIPNYNPNLYACERDHALSRDGQTKIPVSLVYRKSTLGNDNKTNAPVPTHLYAYGAYGDVEDDDFSMSILPLLNRGIVYVTAHVRGGGEKGRKWYEEPNGGKYLCKKHTFEDFVDVAKWLIYERRLTNETMLSCEGASAGGLTVGASLNMNPELFKVAILDVPFVDVFATMVDSSLPSTATEWEEWGNPNEEKYSSYILSYSPMNNVKKDATYPSILLTGGLHDPRVGYWEPTKFAATLRHSRDKNSSNSSERPVLLKIEMTSGHFSASDRYKRLLELSFDYAFILGQLELISEMGMSTKDEDK